jgi:hypothetical protein
MDDEELLERLKANPEIRDQLEERFWRLRTNKGSLAMLTRRKCG